MPMPANHRFAAALFSIGLPTPAFVTFRPSAWFLHWPVMFAGALILALVLKASLASAPSFLRKAVKIAIAVCLLQGFVMFLDWKPFLTAFGLTRNEIFWPVMGAILIWLLSIVWILFSQPRAAAVGSSYFQLWKGRLGLRAHRLCFRDVAGLEHEKEQIRQVAQSCLQAAKYRRYGVVRNGRRSQTPALIWAYQNEWSSAASSQWATVWALLPFVESGILPTEIRQDLVTTLLLLARGQIAAVDDSTSLLPLHIDGQGRGRGQAVFATAVGIVLWRTLEVASNAAQFTRDEARMNVTELVKRLQLRRPSLIGSPAIHKVDNPKTLESYLAWAGLCLAAASLGTSIRLTRVRRLLRLAKQLGVANGKGPQEALPAIVDASAIFDANTSVAVAAAATRVAELETTVRLSRIEIKAIRN